MGQRLSEPDDPYGWVAQGVAARHARRRRLIAFAGAAVAVLLGGLGTIGLLALARDSGPSGPTPPPAGDDPATVASVKLAWQAVPGTLGHSQRLFAASDGMFYALSTAPGPAVDWPPPKAVYSSADGMAWEATLLDGEVGASDMAVRSGVVYLIGTAPPFAARDATPAVAVSSSADGGRAWTSVPLAISEVIPPTPDAFTYLTMRIAAAGAGVVAVVQRSFEIDYWSLLPQDLLVGNRSVEPTAGGVDLVDYGVLEQAQIACDQAMAEGNFTGEEPPEMLPQVCRDLLDGTIRPQTVASLTWEELGLPEGSVASVSEVFVSADGTTFEAVDSPFRPGVPLDNLLAFDDGFLALESGFEGGLRLWESADGRRWEQIDQPPLDWVVAAGTYRGERVLVGSHRGAAAVVWRDEAGAWRNVDLTSALEGAFNQGVWAAAVGPLGVVAIVQGFGEAEGESMSVVHGVAPDDWRRVPLTDIVGGGQGYADGVVVGPDAVLVRYVQSEGPRPVNLLLVGTPQV